MMRGSLLAVSLALLLAPLAAPANAQASGHINSDYQVSGDAQARPVQAFDDGQWLYVQMRDPSNPPAPVGPQGPVAYQMRGPYLVLPLMPRVTLRYGPFQAVVALRGAGDVMPGVVSVNRPIEVLPEASVPMISARPTHSLLAPASVASTMAGSRVEGEITVAGPSRTSTGAASSKSIAADLATSAGSFAGLSGKKVELTADGTTDGAIAVLAAKRACDAAGAVCTINYKGAAPGEIMISEKNQ